MSMIFCPECGHEVSLNAVACPGCGHPFQAAAPPVVERKVVAASPPREQGFPPWAFIPIGILGLVLLFIGYFALRNTDDDANTNVNVNLAGRRSNSSTEPVRSSQTTTVPSTDSGTVSVPSAPSQTTTVPGTATSAPSAPPPDKGTVVIKARIFPPRGAVQNVRNTKFYLLDEDLESILSKARVEPIEGNTLTGSLGLAAVFPDRYGDFQRAAMRAIASNAKYSGTTDGSGGTSLKGIEPGQFYLFGITKVGSGFALWNAPISVIAGDNVLNLSPQSVTEIDANG